MKKILKYIIQKIILKITNKTSRILSILPKSLNIGKYIVIEKNVIINDVLKSIGDGTYICSNTYIHNCNEIGKYCSIARDVSIGVGNHPKDWTFTTPLFYSKSRGVVNKNKYNEKEENNPTVIGNDVWIGTKSIILSGIKVGNGSIIAAGAVVTKDVEPYSIVAGVPAKKIKDRFTEDVKLYLTESNISELSIKKINTCIDSIDDPIKFSTNIMKFSNKKEF